MTLVPLLANLSIVGQWSWTILSVSNCQSDVTKKRQSKMTESTTGSTTKWSSRQSRWVESEGKVQRGAGSKDRLHSLDTS
jgi:hypothetical protein